MYHVISIVPHVMIFGRTSCVSSTRPCCRSTSRRRPSPPTTVGVPVGPRTMTGNRSVRARIVSPVPSFLIPVGSPGPSGRSRRGFAREGFGPLKYPHKTTLRNVPESPRDLARSHVLGKLRPRGFVLRASLWHLCVVSTMQPCRPVAFRPRLSKWHSRCADAKKRQGAPG